MAYVVALLVSMFGCMGQEEAAREAAKGEEKDGEDGDAPRDLESLSRSVIGDEDDEDDEAHAEL